MLSLVTQFKRLSIVAMSERSIISEALSNVRENITKGHQQYQEVVTHFLNSLSIQIVSILQNKVRCFIVAESLLR